MPHIHTQPGQHDHTVSIYLFRTDFSQPKLMLHFHAKMQAYAQFGGHVELHENPWHAAIHELREEAGYDMEQLAVLQPAQRLKSIQGATVHPQPVAHATMEYPSFGGHRHTDSVYVFTTDQLPRHAPEDGESTDIRLFTQEEIAHDAATDPITRDIALYAFDEILGSWQPTPPSEFN
jgi:8-oxo-dGTP pyrophosphatase MutT (NUDIX family)